MKALSLVGARPQFIKEAVIQEEVQKAGIQEILVHSGQHYDQNMSDVFFKVLKMKEPDYNLNVGSGFHGEVTGKIMIEFEKVVLKEKPDVILVYGDTNTTLAGALVGAKLKIPVAHIEAGIRQEPKDMPEEINRVVTDHVSKFLFCPSQMSVKNLEKEGITKGVYFVGDVMYDLFLKMKPFFDYSVVERLNLKENEYIVCTIHRDFNTDVKENLEQIIKNLNRISKEIPIVFPMHPRTRKMMEKFELYDKINNRIITTEPLDYLKTMGLVEKSKLVITDSGGLQKEAYFCGKRAIVVMPDTGWRELVEVGWNRLSMCEEIYDLLTQMSQENIINYLSNIYGTGDSAKKLVQVLFNS